MHIDKAGLELIERFEGLRLAQYRDAVGVPTIGYGTTAGVVSPLPQTCTQAQAEYWLRLFIERECEPAVNGLGVPLNQNQFDALCSLVYNCGPGAMDWQIGRDLRARNYAAAAADFGHYVYAGGQVLEGLVNRRAAERALFLRPVTPKPRHHWPVKRRRRVKPHRKVTAGSLAGAAAVLGTAIANGNHAHLPGSIGAAIAALLGAIAAYLTPERKP